MNWKVSVHTYDIKSHVTRKVAFAHQRPTPSQQSFHATITTTINMCKLTICNEAEQYIKEQAYSYCLIENISMMRNATIHINAYIQIIHISEGFCSELPIPQAHHHHHHHTHPATHTPPKCSNPYTIPALCLVKVLFLL